MAINNGPLTRSTGNGYTIVPAGSRYSSIPITRLFAGACFESVEIGIDIWSWHYDPVIVFADLRAIAAIVITQSGDPQQVPPSPGDPTTTVPPGEYLAYQVLSAYTNMGGITRTYMQNEVVPMALTPAGGLHWNIAAPRIRHDTQWSYYFVFGVSNDPAFDYEEINVKAGWTYWTRAQL